MTLLLPLLLTLSSLVTSEPIDDYVHDVMKSAGIPGLVLVMVGPDGKVAWSEGYGKADDNGFGFNTAIYRYLDVGVTVILLTNKDRNPKVNADTICRKVAELYNPQLARNR